MYIKIFVKIYNWPNKKLVYKTYRIDKLKKYPILKVENSLNIDHENFYRKTKLLQSTYVMLKDTKRNIFYFGKYIN